MKSRKLSSPSGTSMIGLGLGLVAGVAAGILLAPMRGREMRASLRASGTNAWDRGMMLLDEARRALTTNRDTVAEQPLRATLGEIAQMHSGREAFRYEAQS